MARNEAPHEPPVVMTIAGSDSGGGAGIQADLKTIEAVGAYGTSVITSVTAQNTLGVQASHLLPVAHVEAQIDAVIEDFDLRAAKTGMLATEAMIETVASYGERLPALVVDPVMVAASGDRLLESTAESAYEELFTEATLVTPNADEAAVLTGIEPRDEQTAVDAGAELIAMGADAALVKGGHMSGDRVIDVLVTDETVRTFRHDRIATDATHGSGCTLSSAIAANLARGKALETSVGDGIDLLARAVRYNLDVGQGPGAVHHMVETRERAAHTDTAEAVQSLARQFVEANPTELVPEVGTNVVGAPAFAERPGEIAALDGRITRTLDGVGTAGRVRFGASSRVARYLLDAREIDPDLRFAVNWRYDEAIKPTLDSLDGDVVTLDHTPTLEHIASDALEGVESPTGIVDPGGDGRLPLVVIFGHTPNELLSRTRNLMDAHDER